MPRLGDSRFFGGVIASKMDQLRDIKNDLDEIDYQYTDSELERMESKIVQIEGTIDAQLPMVQKDDDLRQFLTEFRALHKSVSQQFADVAHRHEIRMGRIGEVFVPGPEVDSTAPVAGSGQNSGNEQNRQGQPRVDVIPIEDDSLEIYASDNEEPMPLSSMAIVRRANLWLANRLPRHPGPENQRDLRANLVARRSDNQSNRDRRSDRSRSSFSSYASAPMRQFTGAIRGITYPPFARESPVVIPRDDRRIIGTSEYFVHPCTGMFCPLCLSNGHFMYDCDELWRSGMHERWYVALAAGVCLDCLRRGHSHFTCGRNDTCPRCRVRHNSILCRRGPFNPT